MDKGREFDGVGKVQTAPKMAAFRLKCPHSKRAVRHAPHSPQPEVDLRNLQNNQIIVLFHLFTRLMTVLFSGNLDGPRRESGALAGFHSHSDKILAVSEIAPSRLCAILHLDRGRTGREVRLSCMSPERDQFSADEMPENREIKRFA